MSEDGPIISAIAAVAENYVIGKDGDLPWRLPADLRWFVRHTKHKPVIFGRRTYESTGYLKARTNIVLTRDPNYTADCDVVVHSMDDAIEAAGDSDEVMILGGATIYEMMMPKVDRFYLTVVHSRPDGDTHFPPFDAEQWEVSYEEHREPDDKNPIAMTFFVLEREQYGESSSEPDLVPERFRSID